MKLLITLPFEESVKFVTEQTTTTRNKMIIELADNIVVGFASIGGNLEELLKETNQIPI